MVVLKIISKSLFSNRGEPYLMFTRLFRVNLHLPELMLPESELRRFRNLAFRLKNRTRITGAGVTREIVALVKDKWKSAEVVKLKVEGSGALNLRWTHEILEIGAHQFKVSNGDCIYTEKLKFCEVHYKSIGALNTIVRQPTDGKLVGYNTDCDACITAIEDALQETHISNGQVLNASPINGRLFVLVGAGGTGRALAFGAKSKGARVVIFNRNFERAQSLARAVSGEALPIEQLDTFCPENGMILANCSAIGMEPDVHLTPVSKEHLG